MEIKRFIIASLSRSYVIIQSTYLLVHAPIGWRAAGVKNNFCRSPPQRLDRKNRVVKLLIIFIICNKKPWVEK